MKFEYFPETPEHGPEFILRPEGQGEEQRWLTIMRDIALNPQMVVRVIGSKNSDKSVPGQPSNPVLALKLRVERRDGTSPRAAELRKAQMDKLLDPNVPISRQQSVARSEVVRDAKDLGLRVTQGQDVSGHFTVIEE